MTEEKVQEVEEKEESIVFYCKDCEDIVDVNRVGSKYVYKCKKCSTKNVAFGTTKSIQNFFRLDEKKKKDELKKRDGKDEKKIVIEKVEDKKDELKSEEKKVEEPKKEDEKKVEEKKTEEKKA